MSCCSLDCRRRNERQTITQFVDEIVRLELRRNRRTLPTSRNNEKQARRIGWSQLALVLVEQQRIPVRTMIFL